MSRESNGADTTARRALLGLAGASVAAVGAQAVAPPAWADVTAADDPSIAALIKQNSSLTQAALNAKYRSATLVTDYGAKLDGTTDDTAAWNAAYAATPDNGSIVIPYGTLLAPNGITHSRPTINIEGPGCVKGQLTVGSASDSNVDYKGRFIRGVQFDRQLSNLDDAGNACIRIYGALNLKIIDCTFRNAGSAIYIPSIGLTARTIIANNHYINVGWFIRQQAVSGATDWRAMADYQVHNNSGSSTVCGIEIDSVDGLLVQNNTFFFPGYAAGSQTKKYNIRINHRSHYIHIENNNLFEAGYSSISLTDPQYATITSNHVVWPGQRQYGDGIELNFTTEQWLNSPVLTFAQGSIQGNLIVNQTRRTIGFYSADPANPSNVDIAAIQVGSNSMTYNGNPSSYYGTEGKPFASPAYRVWVDDSLTSKPPAINWPYLGQFGAVWSGVGFNDWIKGEARSVEQWINPVAKFHSPALRSAAVTSAGVNVYQLTDALSNATKGFPMSGEITIDARNTSNATPTKSAIYKLLICVSPDGKTSCVQLGSGGNTTGASGGDPAFTWSISYDSTNYFLRATPVGSTSGTFYFYAHATGNLLTG